MNLVCNGERHAMSKHVSLTNDLLTDNEQSTHRRWSDNRNLHLVWLLLFTR